MNITPRTGAIRGGAGSEAVVSSPKRATVPAQQANPA
jgi:hypothetical protein